MYFVYIVECSDKSLYCGYSNNLKRRVGEHNTSKKGAKYTKAKRPVVLRYSEAFLNLSDALKREHAIKALNREDKLKLISKNKVGNETLNESNLTH